MGMRDRSSRPKVTSDRRWVSVKAASSTLLAGKTTSATAVLKCHLSFAQATGFLRCGSIEHTDVLCARNVRQGR